jgi:tripartite-type tricarboxylate transporter receptor subunit TctC
MKLWKIAAMAAASLALLGVTGLGAQDYPARDITIVVGSPPGGPTDTFARLFAQPLQEKLGRSVIVENKPGASGTVAAQAVLAAPADGYTLWFTTPSHLVIPTLVRDPAPFERSAFTPIIGTVYGAGALLAHPSAPFDTLQEFADYAKANPGKVNYASSGAGSTSHIVMEMVKDRLGIDLAHIPYNGNGPAMAALVSGEVQVLGGDLGSAAGALKDKTVKAVSVFALDRSMVVPDVQTADESGLMPGFNPVFYLGFVARADTDPAIIAKLNALLNDILAQDAVKQQIGTMLFTPIGGTPEAFSELYEGDAKATGEIVDKLGLKTK